MNRCKVCGGKLVSDKIGVKTHWRDRSIGIVGISAKVCMTCGRTYVKKHTAAHLNRLERPAEREEFLKNPDMYMNPDHYFSGDGDRL